MFTKVFDTAKRIFSRSPSVQGRSTESIEPPERIGEPNNMVSSTRRGPVPERTPQSSTRKSKRVLEAEETPTQVKKRRRNDGVAKGASARRNGEVEEVDEAPSDAESIRSSIIVQPKNATSVPQPATPTNGKKLAVRTRKSPRVLVTKARTQAATPSPDLEESTDTVQEEDANSSTQDTNPHIPVEQGGQEGSSTTQPDVETENTTPKPQAKEPENAKAATRTMNDPELEETSQAKDVHVRFGSEEPSEPEEATVDDQRRPFRFGVDDEDEDEVEDTKLAGRNTVEMEEDVSDSDEAPEEVTAASARTKTKAAEAEATQAVRAQQEKERAKRKERDERGAKEVEKKRKREERREKKLVKREAKQQAEALDIDIHNLPALLPDSILEAVGDRRPPTPPPEVQGLGAAEKRQEKLKRHIQFLERGEKPIKDIKKGSLNVHVLQQENKRLAPKVNRDTKNVREHWLKGRQMGKHQNRGRKNVRFGKMERRPMAGGFLRNED